MAGEGRGAGIPHVAALDGLRGAAVAAVLLFHGGHLVGGYLGVDLFFTLSGFLITSLLLAESARTGAVGLGGFWARRARRLLPALALLMVGVAVYCVAFATRDQLAQIRGDALATLAYGANWRAVFSHQDYWALFRAPSPLEHTWSLAIEEQFYVIWPLVVVGLLARWRHALSKAVLVTSLSLAAVSSVLMVVLYDPASSGRAYYGTDTRAAAILFGAALAAWSAMRGPTPYRRALETVGVLGAVVLAVAWTRLDGQSSTLYRGGFLVCGLCATAVIAAAVHPVPGVLSRALAFGPLCRLGLISYGVYLYHWPIDVILDQKRVGLGGWPLFAVQTLVTLAVAIASYRFVEQPVRRGALSSDRLRTLTPAIAVGLVAVLVAVTAGARTAKPFITFGHPLRIASRLYRTTPPGTQRVMVMGDSVAGILGQEMQAIKVNPPIAVYNAGVGGCIFPNGVTVGIYQSQTRGKLVRRGLSCTPGSTAGVIARFRPQVVFFILSNPGVRVQYQGRWITPCAEPYDSIYERNLRQEIAMLGSRGAHVVVVTSAYWGSVISQDAPTDCDNRLRRQAAVTTGAQLVDLFRYVCPNAGQRCQARKDGARLRPDGLHYTGPGGEIVARWLVEQARAHPAAS